MCNVSLCINFKWNLVTGTIIYLGCGVAVNSSSFLLGSVTRLPSFVTYGSKVFPCVPDDGNLQAESDSGEFWVTFGGFAPIGKKVASDDDFIPEKTAPKLYR